MRQTENGKQLNDIRRCNVKRILCCLLAAFMLMTLSACVGRPQGGEPTAAPTQSAQHATAEPAATEDPYPTQDPARAAFDPETDCDNRFAPFIVSSMAETEDAYYLMYTLTEFLHYYDKATGDSGVLCPRPECMHDDGPTREDLKKCSGRIDSPQASLSVFGDRLYWVEHSYEYRDYCVFSMGLDGSDKQLVARLNISTDEYQPQNFWIHRGYVYFFSDTARVIGGMPTNLCSIVRESIETGEKQEIFSRYSYMTGEWTLRFIGDDVYIQCGYDGADGSVFDKGEPQTPEDKKALQENTVILRWNPYMEEPEVLLEEPSLNQPDPYCFFVASDGTVWFVRHRPEDPEIDFWDDDFREIGYLCRRDPDGTVTELFSSVIDGELYYIWTVFDGGVIMLQDLRTKEGTAVMCITDLEGNIVFSGDLPTAFMERVPEGASANSLKYVSPQFMLCERSGFVACFEFYYPKDETHPSRQYYVRYDITENGLVETFLTESKTVIYHE